MKRKLGITTGVAVVLVGGGVALGLSLGGNSSHPAPAQIIQRVDQPIADTTTAVSTPTDTVTSSAAAIVAPATTEAQVAQPAPTTSPAKKAQQVEPAPASTFVAIDSLSPGAPIPNLAPIPTPSDIHPPSN